MHNEQFYTGLLFLLLLAVFYFLPALLVFCDDSVPKKNKIRALLVNAFLGWTVTGWLMLVFTCPSFLPRRPPVQDNPH